MAGEPHRNWRDARSALARTFVLALVNCVGELAQVGIQRGKQSSECVPAHIKSPCLGMGYVSLARARTGLPRAAISFCVSPDCTRSARSARPRMSRSSLVSVMLAGSRLCGSPKLGLIKLDVFGYCVA